VRWRRENPRNQSYAWRREFRAGTGETLGPSLIFAPFLVSDALRSELPVRLELVIGAVVVCGYRRA
jgi:hypothetical protein